MFHFILGLLIASAAAAPRTDTSSLKIGTLTGVLKAGSGIVAGSATTADLPESGNLYYTDARARAATSASSPLTYSTGVVGCQTASGSQAGCLSSADWTTFNNKQPAGSYVTTARTISTTAPLTGGGDLSADRTIAMPAATSSANGYLTSSDWTTFNAKESPLTFSSPLSRSVNTISIPAASSSVNGYLSSTDWSTFNNKEPAITAGTTLQYWRGDKSFQTLTTAVVTEVTNLYFTTARVLATTLTGLVTTAGTITSADTILSAIGKLIGNLALKFGTVTYTASTPSRALNTNFTPSASNGVWVSYSIAATCTATIAGGQTSTFELRSDTNATPTTVRATSSVGNSIALAIAITSVNTQTAQLSYLVPPTHNVRLVTSGTCTAVAIASQSEVSIAFSP